MRHAQLLRFRIRLDAHIAVAAHDAHAVLLCGVFQTLQLRRQAGVGQRAVFAIRLQRVLLLVRDHSHLRAVAELAVRAVVAAADAETNQCLLEFLHIRTHTAVLQQAVAQFVFCDSRHIFFCILAIIEYDNRVALGWRDQNVALTEIGAAGAVLVGGQLHKRTRCQQELRLIGCGEVGHRNSGESAADAHQCRAVRSAGRGHAGYVKIQRSGQIVERQPPGLVVADIVIFAGASHAFCDLGCLTCVFCSKHPPWSTRTPDIVALGRYLAAIVIAIHASGRLATFIDACGTNHNAYRYENNRIKTVAHNTDGDNCDVVYRFEYDSLGRKTSVKVGNAAAQNQVLSTNVYSEDRSGLLKEVQYGNGGKVKYAYDGFDRLEGVSYDGETDPRYSYIYDATGEVAKVVDNHLNRAVETERDLAFRPRQSTLKDEEGKVLYRTTLYYDKMNRLEKFAEKVDGEAYTSTYTYDKDNRTTEIKYDYVDPETEGEEEASCNKVAYTYDPLGRIEKRVASVGENNYETSYTFEAGDTSRYGTGATTALVKTITQGSGENAMNFAYAYDDRGNIISETRNGLVTHYVYDALGQLIQVDDPHEQATWKYYYDRGGNITRKDQYVWPAGATSAPSSLGSPTKTINYGYNDPNWKDKLTSYDGKTIIYDAIGNPLNDGVRTYTWGAGRQLRHISMLTGEAHGFRASNGVHEDSNTVLRIVHDAANSKLKVKLLREGRDVTDECAASAFVWTKAGSAAGTGKEITVTDAEVNGDVQFSCSYTETQGVYGTVSVNNSLVASHDPATADANHAFSLLNGMLKVEIPNSAGNGTDYRLADGVLSVNPGFTGTLTAEYAFTTTPTREIDFEYDHNGLRTQKKVVENGITTIYDYTLHGKLITHLTKRVVDENGEESTEELHFFYDAQSKPAFVEYDGAMYRYVHNLQGDIVAIVDTAGDPVVEYKYDAWGKPVGTVPEIELGVFNPFRYRGYAWDADAKLYYLKSRYYDVLINRFINPDIMIGNGYSGATLFVYCNNKPTCNIDSLGYRPIASTSVASETSEERSVSCAHMNSIARQRSSAKKTTRRNKKSTLSEALAEYENITGTNFIESMSKSGNLPYGDEIEMSATVGFVYNSVAYGVTDALSFLGFTGTSDLVSGIIDAGTVFVFGFPLSEKLGGRLSDLIAWGGQVSETIAGTLDNGMHRQYTIVIKASNSTNNSKTVVQYRFDEGVFYNGVSISGIYMPNSLGTGTRVF